MTPAEAGQPPVAWVTGASRGLGRQICADLGEAGYRVIGFGRSAHDGAHPEYGYAPMDLAEPDHVAATMRRLVDEAGPPHAVVANATWDGDAAVGPNGVDQLDSAYEVVLAGHVQMLTFAAAAMARRRHGQIVCIGSAGASFGGVDKAAYTAAKCGLIGITRTLARELGPRGVTVNLVAPGPIDSDAFRARSDRWRRRSIQSLPMKRAAECAEVSSVVSYLLSPAAASITGQVIAVDGGLSASMAP